MRTRHTGRRGLLLAAVLLPAPVLARAAPSVGVVSALRGAAAAERAGARRELAAAMPVHDGEVVTTAEDSRMVLALGESMEVRLGAAVRLRIDRFLARIGGTLVLERGAMLVDRRGGATPGVAVQSPYGLIAVRGTRFFAGPSNGAFGVFVERGAVLLVGASQGVEVTSGFGADVASPGAAPGVPVRWGEARIAAALASVN